MIRNTSRALTVAFATSLALFASGCAGDDTNPAVAVDASIPDGASTLDASARDANAASDANASADANDAAADAPDPSTCTPQASNACIACCEGLYPVGFKKFAKIELTCSCVPEYCGPLDGGADGAAGDAGAGDAAASDAAVADAGFYGQGACAASCTQQQNAGDSCVSCIRQTLGSTSTPGPCGIVVLAQCVEDTDCSPYFSCIEACP